MSQQEVSRRTALGVIAGAVAAPALAKAQPVTEVRVIIQYGVSYLPLMMMEEEEKLLGAALAAQGDQPIELKLQRVSGSNSVNEGLLAGTADMGMMGSFSLLIIAEKARGGVKGLAGTSAFPMVLNAVNDRIKTIADFTPGDRIAGRDVGTPGAEGVRWSGCSRGCATHSQSPGDRLQSPGI